MQLLAKTQVDFIGTRRIPIALSIIFSIVTIVLLVTRGLNLGLDFSGGTLVELVYAEPVEVSEVRDILRDNGQPDAVVQHFGTTSDVRMRLPVSADKDSAEVSNKIIEALRQARGERYVPTETGKVQQCLREGSPERVPCEVQLRRVEFVGPQVGKQLTEQGGLALLITLIGILIYVGFRFRFKFAVGAIVATAHDVLLTFGFFAATQMEFSLSVLAAILAVLGYSLNDTIVVFDRIRENFHKMRRASEKDIMNMAINQTLSRTIITSGTTLLTLLSLFFFGGEIIHGFSVAMIVGILIGTFSSIYIATPMLIVMGLNHDDMVVVKKEGEEASTDPNF